MGSQSMAGTGTAGLAIVPVIMRDVDARSIGGLDHNLLPTSGGTSPLQTQKASARSYHVGHLEAAMRLCHRT